MSDVSISDFITNDTPTIDDNLSVLSSSTIDSDSSKWLPSLNWGSILRYSLIILILSFLGFNLFSYLGKITKETTEFLRPILEIFGFGVANTVKQTVDVSAIGAKGIIDVAAGTVTGGINLLEKGISSKGQLRNMIDNTSIINDILSKSEAKQSRYASDEPIPDDAGSRTQSSKSIGKSGFCYIGEDRGFRSCIKVGEADMCMSGDIFPSQEICINPNLRE